MKQPSKGPLFPDPGSRLHRLTRRTLGIFAEVLAFVLITVLLPVLLAGALVVDFIHWLLSRKPWTGLRLMLMLWWFLFGEIRALVSLGGAWILTGGPFGNGSLARTRWLYVTRIRWARSHLGGFRVLFGLTFEVEGLDLAAEAPYILMMRHASIIDNMLPDALVGRAHGIGLRFVIKKELQVLPTIDIGGRWAPTIFVRRGSADVATELLAIRSLAHDLGPGGGVLIYPEGTRPTPAKLARAQAVIAERQPEVAPLAARLNHLLPPRLGGPLALIDEAPELDVIFCGHTGFDGLRSVGDIWAGRLVGKTIRVRFWRAPAAGIPADEADRTEWLYDRWQELDDWVDEQLTADPA